MQKLSVAGIINSRLVINSGLVNRREAETKLWKRST